MKIQTLIRVIAVLFTIFTLTIIYRADAGLSLMIVGIHSVPMLDKVIHLLFCGILTFLLNLAVNNRRVTFGNRQWLLMSLIVFVLFTIEEFSQMFLSKRNFDLLDLSANYLGIVLGSWLAIRVNKRQLSLTV